MNAIENIQLYYDFNDFWNNISSIFYFSLTTTNTSCLFRHNLYFIIPYIDELFLYSIYLSEISMTDSFFYTYYNVSQLYLFTKVASYNAYLLDTIEFFCLHNFIWIVSNETILIFFRLYNNSSFDVDCISIYIIYPFYFSFSLVKLQCFCFSSIFINSTELLEMPVIFYFENQDFENILKNLYVFYLLLPYNHN